MSNTIINYLYNIMPENQFEIEWLVTKTIYVNQNVAMIFSLITVGCLGLIYSISTFSVRRACSTFSPASPNQYDADAGAIKTRKAGRATWCIFLNRIRCVYEYYMNVWPRPRGLLPIASFLLTCHRIEIWTENSNCFWRAAVACCCPRSFLFIRFIIEDTHSEAWPDGQNYWFVRRTRRVRRNMGWVVRSGLSLIGRGQVSVATVFNRWTGGDYSVEEALSLNTN